ncbi:MAG: 16S rRNA (uracil(1498)-N(3))-methyltransferase [Clostridium sp.]|nr:16S rRNA (uracil(1498)-N(3))-methyltransferase [Clostridium sp.]MCM1444657.1 16S rRNA (uracil(1498)-N(3))-methyltransferase [Candidatus Amulumruptor caecigallinarius]
MQRYFCKDIKDKNVILDDTDYFHIIKVMRMKNNDSIEVVFDKNLYECKIVDIDNKNIKVIKKIPYTVNNREITLIIPLLKEQKMDFVLQKATELGVDKIVPFYSERSIVKNIDEDKKLARWNKICKEASEQSKRVTVPIVTSIKNVDELNFDGVKLMCSTREKKQNLKLFFKMQEVYDKINIVVGPEGGLTELEEKNLNSIGYKSVTLGTNILRVETVPIFILSILNYEIME